MANHQNVLIAIEAMKRAKEHNSLNMRVFQTLGESHS